MEKVSDARSSCGVLTQEGAIGVAESDGGDGDKDEGEKNGGLSRRAQVKLAKKERRREAKEKARADAKGDAPLSSSDTAARTTPARTATVPLASAVDVGRCVAASDAALEAEYVHGVYNAIAGHFSQTRHSAWPVVRAFIESLPCGALMADVGCGNGKYLGLCSKRVCSFGSDRSEALAALCAARGHEVMVCDALSLPYRDGAFDAAISIAVIHHFVSSERRVRALREMARVLHPGGKALVFVWAYEQNKHGGGEAQDVLIPWHLQATAAKNEVREAAIEPAVVYQRYYHLFKHGELEALVGDVGGLRVVASGFDHENWYAIAEKE